jgi:hypothetical protein
MSTITSLESSLEKEPVSIMYKEIHSWAVFSLILGGISIFSGSTLDPVWGFLMIVVAILSRKTRFPGMFAVYAVVMGWAAVMNALSVLSGGELYWLILAVFQIGWTVSLVKKIKKFSQLNLAELYRAGQWPTDLAPPQDEEKLANKYAGASAILATIPWAIFSLACGSIILLVILFTATQTMPAGAAEGTALPVEDSPGIGQNYFCSGTIYLAVLSLAFGLAAMVSRTSKRKLAISGIVASSLFLSIVLILWTFSAIYQFLYPWAGG